MNRTWNVSLTTALVLSAGSAAAATLTVGPDQSFKTPSAAINAASDGDTISIQPGRYFDCAVVRQNDLTIEGTGRGAVMTDKTCQGKAILVINGNNVTIRNLTLQRARVPDQNGAGIRAQGGKLTIEDSRFLNNENGILAANNPEATITITRSDFIGNGKCASACAHGIYVNRIALLHIDHSRFLDTHEGHHIKSRAARTEVINDEIEDGPTGTSSYLIDIPNGGDVLVDHNTMEKGPHSNNQANAIMIGEEGVSQPTDSLVFSHNKFTNDQARIAVFVHNITATPAQLVGNVFQGPVRPLEGDGSTR